MHDRLDFDKEWIAPLSKGFWEPTSSTCYGDVRYRKRVDYVLCPQRMAEDGICIPEYSASLYIGVVVIANSWHYSWQVKSLGRMIADRLNVPIDSSFDHVIASAKEAAIRYMRKDT